MLLNIARHENEKNSRDPRWIITMFAFKFCELMQFSICYKTLILKTVTKYPGERYKVFLNLLARLHKSTENNCWHLDVGVGVKL